MKSLLCILLCTVCCLLSANPAAAQLTMVAQANFDADTIGAAPDGTLPGGPDGDSFFYPTFFGDFSVVASIADLNNQPVRGERPAGAGSFNFGLNVPSSAATAQDLVIRFRYAPISGAPYLLVILRGPNLALHGSLTLTGSSVLFSTAFGSQNNINVGTETLNQAQLFEWRVNRTTGIQSLSIDDVLVVDAMATSYTAAATNFTQLSFESGFQSAMVVAVDDLEIFTGTGTTPVEASSWGQVKALYR